MGWYNRNFYPTKSLTSYFIFLLYLLGNLKGQEEASTQ